MERTKGLVRTFAALFIATATARLGLGIIAPILPLYADTFSASGLEIGLVFAAFSVSRALLGPVVGRLSDQIGRKPLIVVGLAGYAVVSLLYATAGSLWELGMYRFLQGIASVLVTPIAQAYVGDLIPKGKEGRYANLFYASQFLGLAVGPMLGGGIGAAWSYETAFYVMGGLTLIALVLVMATVPADRTLYAAVHSAKERVRRGMLPEARNAFRVLLHHDAVKAIFAYVGSRGFWRSSFTTFYPLFAAASLGANEADVGVVLSAYMFAEAIIQVPAGFLADRFPRIRQIVVASILAPMALVVVPFLKTTEAALGAAVFMGAFSALGRASLVAIRTELGRIHGMATLAGLQGSAFSAGQMLGPILGGIVVDAFGNASVFPLAFVVGSVGSVLVIGWMKRWLRVDPEARSIARE